MITSVATSDHAGSILALACTVIDVADISMFAAVTIVVGFAYTVIEVITAAAFYGFAII